MKSDLKLKIEKSNTTIIERLIPILLSRAAEYVNDGRGKELVNSINPKGDLQIGMDIALDKLIIELIIKSGLPTKIFSEESGWSVSGSNPSYLSAIDPLDGSVNFKYGNGLSPFGTMISIYNGNQPKIGDVVAAGLIEHTSYRTWTLNKNFTLDKFKERVSLDYGWKLGKGCPIGIDFYYPEAWDIFRPLSDRFFARGAGSTSGNLTAVLSGAHAAMCGVCVRPEEVGTIYALIKGSGGIVLDLVGDDVGTRAFDAKSVYPLIAGNPFVVEKIIEVIRSSKES